MTSVPSDTFQSRTVVSWLTEDAKFVQLPAKVEEKAYLDNSPYLITAARQLDDYEAYAVVYADHMRARVYLAVLGALVEEGRLRGDIKNHVRKGGWSQQRYERRRDKQLLHYARDICAELAALARAEAFHRIILVGGKEILGHVEANLPGDLAPLVAGMKPADLGKGQNELNRDIWEVFFAEERHAEEQLWERIQAELGRGGRAAAGLDAVLDAAGQGRIETLLVDRTFTPEGARCHGCDRLHAAPTERCEACGGTDLYPVRIVNELCEKVALTGGETEFADPIPSLTEAGSVAALLRW